MKHNQKIPIISFYTGGGFLDMGFEMANFKVVWSNEFDKTFAALHSAGITSWRSSRNIKKKAEIFNQNSIREISSEKIVSEAFPKKKPKHFGIIGGPPCQDFSMRGKLKGFAGERGKLTILYFDKILELKPTFFVMENVTGLIRSKSHKHLLAQLLERVRLEYYIDYKVLNSIEFGVPQSRERVFFVGIRKDCLDENIVKDALNGSWFDWPTPQSKYNSAETRYDWPSATSFGGAPEQPTGIPIELFVNSCLVSKTDEAKISNADEYFNLYVTQKALKAIAEGETNRPSFKRLHRYKYSPTACYGNNEVHLHPFENRRISVREALRIQGVPDTYILPPELPLSKKFKMIGNGVPVPLAKAVARALERFIAKQKVLK